MIIFFIDIYLHIYIYTHTCCYIWKKHTLPIWLIYPPKKTHLFLRGDRVKEANLQQRFLEMTSGAPWIGWFPAKRNRSPASERSEFSVWKMWSLLLEMFNMVDFFLVGSKQKRLIFGRERIQACFCADLFSCVGGRGKSHGLMLDLKKSHPSLYS